jgi:CheY-like chemotaxis protein
MTEPAARVLVVDDSTEAAELLVELLRGSGYVARPAFDGGEALSVVADFDPHCVLLDIEMPGIDGYELARRLRERHGDEIVLIAVTGASPDDERVAAAFEVVDHWFTKPLDVAQLQRVLPPV